MVEPEQVLHAVMVLSWEQCGDGPDEDLIEAVQNKLNIAADDRQDAINHISDHRGDGDWGGRKEQVIGRSLDRLENAFDANILPTKGKLGEQLVALLELEDTPTQEEENIEDIDPFEELVGTASHGSTAAGAATLDPLEALMAEDDDEEEEEQEFNVGLGGQLPAEDEQSPVVLKARPFEDVDAPSEEEQTESDADESESSEPADAAMQTYRLLLETVWVDGVLDPAEVQLLARKRAEFDISFETHLELVRTMLES
jgi:hypothetical protein